MKHGILYYNDEGPKEAPPLLLIHAFPLNHTMWKAQTQEFKNKYRVISYDVRGHGESDLVDGQYTIELFVDDLISLLDHLKIDKAIICGLSMGGYISLRAVERNPERFSALVLCDTRSEADSNEAKLKRFAAVKVIKENGLSVFAEGFIKPVFASDTFKKAPQIVETVKEMIVKNSAWGISGTLLALASRTDTTESLKKIQIPTLILVGQEDQITPPEASQAMKDKIPHAQMYVIPHAGHLSNLENPTEFNQRLIMFLSEIGQ